VNTQHKESFQKLIKKNKAYKYSPESKLEKDNKYVDKMVLRDLKRNSHQFDNWRDD
jgi:hypothetical protein